MNVMALRFHLPDVINSKRLTLIALSAIHKCNKTTTIVTITMTMIKKRYNDPYHDKKLLGDIYQEHAPKIASVADRIIASYQRKRDDPDNLEIDTTIAANEGCLQSLEAALMKDIEQESLEHFMEVFELMGYALGSMAQQAIVSFVSANSNNKIT